MNSQTAYGSLTRLLHWLTAVLILANIGLGLTATWAPFNSAEALAQKTWLFSLHKTLGVTLFFVALLRVAAGLVQTRPDPLTTHGSAERLAATTVHWLLYAALILVPLSGWIHHAATDGFAPILWPLGQSLPLVPKSQTVFEIAGALHYCFVLMLVGAIVLHIAGAMKHTILDRDGTLARMVTGRAAPTIHHTKRSHAAAGLVALLVVSVAIGFGWTIGTSDHDRDARLALKTAPTSTWRVDEGRLQITIQQLGANVTGTFETWSADIEFAEPENAGPAGNVSVTIDIASLQLGAVSAQAMGPDFFDVERFPTALFEAKLMSADEAYVANGTLTVRGQTHPLRMPFDLQINDGIAQMAATHVLDRGDFGIGQNFSDASQLGFKVVVDITLTAQEVN